MKIERILSDPLNNNVYVVSDDKNAFVVDASCSAEILKPFLEGKNLKGVILTHGHYDHIVGIDDIVKKYGVKCYLTKECKEKLFDATNNCSDYFGLSYISRLSEDDLVVVNDGQKLDFLNKIDVCIHKTEGHTDCGICISVGDNLFTGDTIFYRSVGRTDLPTSSSESLYKSIEKINTLFKNYRIYPGHGRDFIL